MNEGAMQRLQLEEARLEARLEDRLENMMEDRIQTLLQERERSLQQRVEERMENMMEERETALIAEMHRQGLLDKTKMVAGATASVFGFCCVFVGSVSLAGCSAVVLSTPVGGVLVAIGGLLFVFGACYVASKYWKAFKRRYRPRSPTAAEQNDMARAKEESGLPPHVYGDVSSPQFEESPLRPV